MSKKKSSIVLLVLILLISQLGCKKESNNSRPNTQLLTEQAWILVSFRYNFNNGPWTDGFVTIPNCQKDNKLSFQSTLNYILDEGTTKCNSSDPQIFQQGTWYFTTNETKLASVYNGSTSIVDIVLLDNVSLKTSRKDTLGINTGITEVNYTH